MTLGKRSTNGRIDEKTTGQGVLIVDDDLTILSMLTPVFEARNFKVFTAPSGESGLDLFRSRRWEIALIVTDIRMPGMSGIEMAASILEVNPKLPVIFISGYAGMAFKMDSQGLISRYRFVEKPFSPIRLVEAAEHLLPQGRELARI